MKPINASVFLDQQGANDASSPLPSDWISAYQEALDQAAIVAVTDPTGRIISVNDKFCELSGYSKDELLGANHRLLRSGVHDRQFFQDLYRAIHAGRVWHGEICNRAKSGKLYWVDTTIVPHRDGNGQIDRFTAIRFDITLQKDAEDKLWQLANVDSLTGLPNRLSFMRSLNQFSTAARANDIVVGLMDVDHFKDINDSLGHAAGDDLLVEIARRLRRAMLPDDVIARLGGDEFALIFRDCPTVEDKEARIARLYEALATPVWLEDDHRKVSVSLGVARIAEEGSTAAELLRHADIALYAAKETGRGKAKYFCSDMRADIDRRVELLSQFSKAIERGELRVFYQPVVAMGTRQVVKYEALLRWQHPDRGLLGPADFADALDDHALAAAADAQVLEMVLRDLNHWKSLKDRHYSVAINSSIGDFHNSTYVDRIVQAMRCGVVDAGEICVEITERIVIGHRGNNVRDAIETLHNCGVGIAFDDFGTGFASLRHLLDLPVDFVKIDKSFIRSIVDNAADRAVVEGIIRLSHQLGKTAIAEGVETVEQENVLRELKCDYVQGFLFSAAIESEKVPHFDIGFQ